MATNCDHKCHKVGLNPWVEVCPICGCANEKFDPKIPQPQTWDELINWDRPTRLSSSKGKGK